MVQGGIAELYEGTAEANGNSVAILDSAVHGEVVGGGIFASNSSSTTATGNTVTLGGAANLIGDYWNYGSVLAGGYSRKHAAIIDLFTANTLNIVRPASGGVTVGLNFVQGF